MNPTVQSSVSVVIPAHNEEENIRGVYERVAAAIPDRDLEIIFVDDGSTDSTLERVQALRSSDPRVNYVSMYTNYGHQKALMAGLRASSKDLVFSLDCDLQHPPEYFGEFERMLKMSKVDIVNGRRKNRQAGFFKQSLSNGFNWFFAQITGVALTPGVSDFRLCTRHAAAVLGAINEPDPFVRGMISYLRLRTAIVDYDMAPRAAGQPAYTFRKSLRMAMHSLIRFSDAPIRIGLLAGLAGILFSVGEGLHYIYLKLFTNNLVPGQADLMVFLSLLGSMILVLLSLLLRYTRQLLAASRLDPSYIVKEQSL